MAQLVQPTSVEAGNRRPIELVGWTIEGVSVAGQETCILLPQLKVAFDIGRCPSRSISHQHVFVTHGHMDHIGGIPFHAATRALMAQKPTKLYSVPPVCTAAQALIDVHSSLEREAIPIDIQPIGIGDEVPLGNGHCVRPFKTVHVVESQGYLIYQRRNKIKPEFANVGKHVIIEAKKRGVEIVNAVETAEVAFTGDTSVEMLQQLPPDHDVFHARLLILECTFLDDAVDQAGAKGRGHMHVRDIAQHADKFKNQAILLIHFSARYKAEDVLRQLDVHLPASLRPRVYPFLQGFSLS